MWAWLTGKKSKPDAISHTKGDYVDFFHPRLSGGLGVGIVVKYDKKKKMADVRYFEKTRREIKEGYMRIKNDQKVYPEKLQVFPFRNFTNTNTDCQPNLLSKLDNLRRDAPYTEVMLP